MLSRSCYKIVKLTKVKRCRLTFNSCFSSRAGIIDKSVGIDNGIHFLRVNGCNKEIHLLGRRGRVEEARKVFDEMPQRNSASYSTMISAYLRSNDVYQAEKIFLAMPERNLVADSAMVSGYVKAGRIIEARHVFDEMPERNVFSWTSLVSGYFKLGDVDEALRLFWEMPEKNVVSWTTVVLGLARNGCVDQARHIFDQMPQRNVIAWTVMVKSYVDSDQIEEAFELFYRMPHRNLYSWHTMISGCLDANLVEEAIRLFRSMPERSPISWTIMVTGLARGGRIEEARECFEHMPVKDIAAWNAMITAYCDGGKMKEARDIFELMPEKNVVSWNTLIDGYTRSGPEWEALKLLTLMLRSNYRPNEITITSVLSSSESLIELMQVHALVLHFGFDGGTSLMNCLITMYSRCGDVHSSRLAFNQLESKDIVSWTALILAYANHGYGRHALQAYARMVRSGETPDDIAFVGVLSACSHAGLVNKGQNLFHSMTCAYGLKPRAVHYSCLVDMLGRAGQVNKAMEVVEKMPLHEHDGAVLGALLGACRLTGNIKLANQIGEKLIELQPTSGGSYVLLAGVYASCGKWEEFAQVRKKMKERNVKKSPGFSQVEVKGKNHVFFAGDKSHPQIEMIYEFLQKRLFPMMREKMGQSQTTEMHLYW